MAFLIRSIEWRCINNSSWHLFFGNRSLCGRAESTGKFEFADTIPPQDGKKCKWCEKEKTALAERVKALTG